MRWALTLTAFLMTAAWGKATPPGEEAKQRPTDDAIIGACGGRLAKVFARFGTPENVSIDSDKKAILDYGAFAFGVDHKTVKSCYFFADWKETIRGIKFGDTREQVVETLGKKYEAVKGKDFEAYGWDLKEQDATFWVYFEDNKVSRIQITLNK